MAVEARPWVGSRESLRDDRVIRPDAIKERVMDFFEEVDLEKVGESKKGPFSFKATFLVHVPEFVHSARLNGLMVAKYSHIPKDAELEPLGAGDDRITAQYVLQSHVDWEGYVSIWYTEYERQSARTVINLPRARGSTGQVGLVEDMNEDSQERIAKLLRLRI